MVSLEVAASQRPPWVSQENEWHLRPERMETMEIHGCRWRMVRSLCICRGVNCPSLTAETVLFMDGTACLHQLTL